jgi:hypothetical protein
MRHFPYVMDAFNPVVDEPLPPWMYFRGGFDVMRLRDLSVERIAQRPVYVTPLLDNPHVAAFLLPQTRRLHVVWKSHGLLGENIDLPPIRPNLEAAVPYDTKRLLLLEILDHLSIDSFTPGAGTGREIVQKIHREILESWPGDAGLPPPQLVLHAPPEPHVVVRERKISDKALANVVREQLLANTPAPRSDELPFPQPLNLRKVSFSEILRVVADIGGFDISFGEGNIHVNRHPRTFRIEEFDDPFALYGIRSALATGNAPAFMGVAGAYDITGHFRKDARFDSPRLVVLSPDERFLIAAEVEYL